MIAVAQNTHFCKRCGVAWTGRKHKWCSVCAKIVVREAMQRKRELHRYCQESNKCTDCGCEVLGRKKRRCDECLKKRTADKARSHYVSRRRQRVCRICGVEFIGTAVQNVCQQCSRGEYGGNIWKHVCQVCGREYVNKRKGSVVCSKECAAELLRKHPNHRVCVGCGKEFVRKKRSKGSNTYCSRECRFEHIKREGFLAGLGNPEVKSVLAGRVKALRSMEVVRDKHRLCNVVSRLVKDIKRCQHCGIVFCGRRAKYCSTRCANAAQSQQLRVMASAKIKTITKWTCRICGAVVSQRGNQIRNGLQLCKRCGADAARWRMSQSRRAREAGVMRIEKFNKVDVFERDGWRCQLCGRPVMRIVTGYNPRMATVDHIVPLSRGGPHTIDNCQTACMMCNATKQDKLMSEIGEEVA